MISISTWWVRKRLYVIFIVRNFVLCNRFKSSKTTKYFELFWAKYFHFSLQNVSTYFSTFYLHIYWILTLEKHVPKELSLQMMEKSEYSNSNLLNLKLRKPEVVHFRRQSCDSTAHCSTGYKLQAIITWQRCAWKLEGHTNPRWILL